MESLVISQIECDVIHADTGPVHRPDTLLLELDREQLRSDNIVKKDRAGLGLVPESQIRYCLAGIQCERGCRIVGTGNSIGESLGRTVEEVHEEVKVCAWWGSSNF